MSSYGEAYTPLDASGPSRTKQSMKDECDVNNIMVRYQKTGLLTHTAKGLPQFADVSAVADYRTAIDNVRAVQDYFDGLPSKVRQRFENDPREFMEYLESGASQEDLEALGLEVLGDRRAPAQDRRESDVAIPAGSVEPPPDAGPEGGSGTVST